MGEETRGNGTTVESAVMPIGMCYEATGAASK